MTPRRYRVAVVVTHPIQYYAPWYRALAQAVDLEVFFCHRQTSEGQAKAGFGVAFEWDVPLLDGYKSTFLKNVARHPNVERFGGCNTPELKRRIADGHFDAVIVHGWSTRSYWQAMTACWRTGTPVLVRGDSTLRMGRPGWWQTVKRPIYRAFIPKFSAYLVVGSRSREYLLHYGADPAWCFEAPHAVDNAYFAAQAATLRARRADLRREFGLPEDAFVALFAGRFVDRKRPNVFVDAIAAASQRVPTVVGLMAGDGPLKAETAARIKSRGARIAMTGFLNQSEIARAYVAADLLVVPSTWETWGLVVNEAMACGLPAAVSDGVACAGDLVIDGDCGVVTPIGDVDALASNLVRLAADRDTLVALTRAAERQIARFGFDRTVAGTLAALAALDGRRQAERRAGGRTAPQPS